MMKRRSFVASLAALPLVGKLPLMSRLAIIEPEIKPEPEWFGHEIMSETDITVFNRTFLYEKGCIDEIHYMTEDAGLLIWRIDSYLEWRPLEQLDIASRRSPEFDLQKAHWYLPIPYIAAKYRFFAGGGRRDVVNACNLYLKEKLAQPPIWFWSEAASDYYGFGNSGFQAPKLQTKCDQVRRFGNGWPWATVEG